MIKIIIFIVLFVASTNLMPNQHIQSKSAIVETEVPIVVDVVPSVALTTPVPAPTPPPPPPQLNTAGLADGCVNWIEQSNLVPNDTILTLIRRESNCRPDAINSSSGACGIAQSLPCEKMNCSLSDPVCQIKWMNNYIIDRYGSWDEALAFHYSNNWY